MGLFVEFDVIDDLGYLDMTEEYAIVPDYSEGCQVFAITFLEVARQLVPVDTGYLRSTLKAEGYDTYCYAETDCEYAQYPEFGTWCQAEQPYFRPALEQAIMAAKPYWDRAQQQALIEEEMLIEAEEDEEEDDFYSTKSSSIGGIGFMGLIWFLLAMFFIAVIIVSIEAIMGKDFGYNEGGSSRGRNSIGIDSDIGLYIPEVIIT